MRKKDKTERRDRDPALRSTKEISDSFIRFFVLFYLICFVITVIMAILTRGGSWRAMLFSNGGNTDLFMDFFNSIRDSGARDVYSGRNNIYPPLSLLLFRFLGLFVDRSLVDTDSAHRFLLQVDLRCNLIYLFFVCVCVLFMVRVLSSFVSRLDAERGAERYNKLLSLLMVLSYPCIYCIERGNILLLCFVCTAFFVFFNDSENKLVKELSLFALAVAAGIKLYPAVFGVILLFEKKYKEAVRTVAYGLICIAVPALFFITPGRSSAAVILPGAAAVAESARSFALTADPDKGVIINLIQNIIKFAVDKKSSLNFSSISAENFVYLFGNDLDVPAKILFAVTELVAVCGLFFIKKKWQRLFLLCYIMLNIPAASASYSLIFLIIPLYVFLFEEPAYSGADRMYMLFFTLLLVPIPTVWYPWSRYVSEIFRSNGYNYNSRINQLIATFVFQAMFLSMIAAEISLSRAPKSGGKSGGQGQTDEKKENIKKS